LLGVRGDEDHPANRLFGAAKPSKPFSVTAQIKKSYEQNQSFAENHPELPTIPAAQ
jgi:hypothetical protein